MGRSKKVISIDHVRFGNMATAEKLELFNDFNQLFHHELSRIPYSEITVTNQMKAESVAEEHFRKQGFEVFRSRTKDGYRCIGVEFYWTAFRDKISDGDKALIRLLRGIMTPEDFEELAGIVENKNGTPDLLLIKNGKLEFVEVKANYETVKPSTVEFFIKYGQKWPISILRILSKSGKVTASIDDFL